MGVTAIALLLCTSLVLAQERSVSGSVTDEEGIPLPGVNILVKGTANGTVSEPDGRFTIANVPENATLVVSFIGYLTQEVAVGTNTNLSIRLLPDVQALEEVVVVGYGEQKKSLTTGAISSVRGEELQNISVGQAEQALQGRTSGVFIAPNSGSPGAAARVNIRGSGSTGLSNPLYIVDGIRLTGAGALDLINPSDIASIEVLKDAASAAIYGAEGANGVIIVTTKKGKPNSSQINYSGQYGMQSARPGMMDVMNAQQYVQYLQEADASGRPTTTDLDGTDTDWLDVAFDDAPQMSHSIDFSGGTDKSTFFVGGSYFTQEGIAGGKSASFERYSVRINSAFDIKKWLKVGENFTYSNINRRGLNEDNEYGGTLQGAMSLDPLTPAVYTGALPAHAQARLDEGRTLLRNGSGQYYGISKWLAGEFANPLARYDLVKGTTRQHNILGNVFMDIKPFEGLTFTSRFGINAFFSQLHNWTPTFYFNDEQLNTLANGNDEWRNNFRWLWENYASYDKTVGDHHFTVLAGTAWQRDVNNVINGSYAGLFQENPIWSYPDFVPNEGDRIGGTEIRSSLLSYFARVNYDFAGKYLFNATVRRDGSSVLADGKQWGTFPSASLGWVISSEDFFEGTPAFWTYAKVRASWGQNGSLSNISPGQWMSVVSTADPGRGLIQYADADGNLQVGAAPTALANPDLTWETSEQIDIGADFRFVNDRLTFSADYFVKTTKDLIAPARPPGFVGLGMPFLNAGTVQNKGWEFELGYTNDVTSRDEFSFTASGNITFIKNEVTELNSAAQAPAGANVAGYWTGATYFEVGQPIWYFRGYKTAGIFQNQAQIDQYINENDLTGYAPKPGDPIIVNTNGDNIISPADYTNIGSPHPDFYYGLRLSGAFKGFDLTMFLQGQSGNDILMGFIRTDRSTTNKPLFFYEDRWTGDGSTNDWFRPQTTGDVYTSDYMVKKGGYARVRQLQLGYTLPASTLQKIGASNVRIYVSLDNYFTFTDYPGLDPEAGTPRVNSLGIDRGVYPIPRKILGGLTFTF